jgi:putative hemolysin
MNLLHKCSYPLAKLLSSSTRVVLALLRLNTSARDTITEDEIKSVLDEGIKSGALEVHERDMVEGVLTLADRPVRLVMTPRVDAVCLHLEDDYQMNLKKITGTRHSVFPLVDKSPDAIIGTIDIKDLLQRFATGEKVDLKSLARSPLFIPDNLSALKALQRLKETGNHAGLVLDEYGSFDGIITINDLTQVITGEAISSVEDMQVHQRDDGSWLIDGRLPIEDVKEALGISTLPEEDKGHYETAAGLILVLLGRIPTLGESCDWQGFRFEIVDMDGRRIDKLLVTALPGHEPGK